MSKERTKKKPGLWLAIVPVALTVLILTLSITVFGVDVQVPLIIGTCITAIIAIVFLGYSWQELETGAINSVMSVMQAILLLIVIGATIGTWISGGIVPSLVYYGLKMLTPGLFLIASMIICSIVSIAAGGSWATVGTIGIALIGIARGLNIPLGMAGGAIISGAYFGDKMSPLSDTTNLAAAVAGSTLLDHIKHMFFTTVFAYGIALVIYGIAGIRFASQPLDSAQINGILDALAGKYVISPLLLLVPVLVIVIVALKVPAIPGLFTGTVLGLICTVAVQGADWGSALNAIMYGVVSETGHEMVDGLLTNGGFMNMMWVISLIICARAFGGVLETAGMMNVIAMSLLRLAHKTGSLILVTVVSAIFCNILLGDHCIAIAIPGRMYKDEYKKRGLAPRNLSRALEDGGTVTSPLIPWNTCGATMSGFLGIPTLAYAPFSFFNILCPIFSILFGYTGFTIMKLVDDPSAEEYTGKKAVAS
jgi:NhaC family Na+:H+ antiporter